MSEDEKMNRKKATLQCTVCEKVLATLGSLRKHIKLHIGIKPFKCDICGKAFQENHDLIRHVKYVHLTVKESGLELKCEYCHKVLKGKDNLKKHLERHTLGKTFECSFCQKKFSTNANLISHLTLHSGDNSYFCDKCNESFRTDGLLKSHMVSHTGERPHKCKICSKGFLSVGDLNIHLKSIHNIKFPYGCSKCSMGFKFTRQLKAHVLDKHGDHRRVGRLDDEESDSKVNGAANSTFNECTVILKRYAFIEEAIQKQCKSVLFFPRNDNRNGYRTRPIK